MASIDASKLKPATLGTEVNSLLAQAAGGVLLKGVVEEIIYIPETFDSKVNSGEERLFNFFKLS